MVVLMSLNRIKSAASEGIKKLKQRDLMLFRDFLENSIEDFRGFFYDQLDFKIKIIEKSSNMHIGVRGAGDEKKICISKDMANFEINDPIDYMMALMIVGHEIAHCLCEHNKFQGNESIESRAIEGYADYFGARITYSLLNFGRYNFKEFLKMYGGVPFSSKSELFHWMSRYEIFRITGLSLKKLNDLFYQSANGTNKYPGSETRIITFIAGVVSFFFRYHGNVSQDNFLKIFCTIWDSGGFVASQSKSSTDHIEKIGEIHSAIQNGNKKITSGITDKYSNLLSTEFDSSNNSKRRRVEGFIQMFSKWDDEFSKDIINHLNSELKKFSF